MNKTRPATLALAQTRLIWLFAGISLLHPAGSEARIFDYRQGNLDLIYLDDPMVDYEVRNRMIEKAKSVQIISPLQGIDEIGLNTLNAIRKAQKNGATVEYIMEASMARSPIKPIDRKGESIQVLTDSSMKNPASVFTGSLLRKLKAGLSLDDYNHLKLTILNAGTPEEVIFVGGRGYSDFDKRVLDSAFLIRPLDPSAPWIGQDIHRTFKEVRRILPIHDRKAKTDPLNPKLREKVESPPPIPKTAEQIAKTEEILARLNQPPKAHEPLLPYQFRPAKARVLTNDALKNIMKLKPGDSTRKRLAKLPNDIHAEIARLMEQVQEVHFSSYLFHPTPVLDAAIKRLVARNGKFNLFTNGRSAHQQMLPTGAPVDFTNEGIIKLSEHSPNPNENIKAYFLETDQVDKNAGPTQQFRYLHKKEILLGEEIVAQGSDNWTIASGIRNQEITVIFHDRSFNQHLRALAEENKRIFFRQTTPCSARFYFLSKPLIDRVLYPLIERMY